jgi:hypothetical protein
MSSQTETPKEETPKEETPKEEEKEAEIEVKFVHNYNCGMGNSSKWSVMLNKTNTLKFLSKNKLENGKSRAIVLEDNTILHLQYTENLGVITITCICGQIWVFNKFRNELYREVSGKDFPTETNGSSLSGSESGRHMLYVIDLLRSQGEHSDEELELLIQINC